MGSDVNKVLQQAMEFHVAGQEVEARALLLDLVRTNPQLEAGWMFLSYTLEDPQQKADCLRQVLKLNPRNTEAKSALEQLIPAHEPELQPAVPTTAHASPFTVDISHANDELIDAEGLPEGQIPPAKVAAPPFSEAPESKIPDSQVVERQTEPAPAAEMQPPEPVVAEVPPGESPPAIAQKSVPASAKPVAKPVESHEAPKPKKRGNLGCTCLTIAVVVILVTGAIIGGLWLTGNLPALFNPGSPAGVSTASPSVTETPIVWTLPPRWTDTPSPTITSTPTISLTPTQTLTPTLAPPDATQEADIAKLQKQVMDLRGLEWKESLPIYIVSRDQAEIILQRELDKSGYKATIGNETKVLVALGMIKPTYDLAKYALTRLSDFVLGFYMPSDRTIYVIGNRFGGMEHYVFAHEYDHALVHHFFPAVGISDSDPICVNDSQRCEAIRALVEGDATLIMYLWRTQYASAYDERDIEQNLIPFSLAPEENTPPYISPAVNFPYNWGANFVYSIYQWKNGYWAAVNKVYDNLPVSTEQILHPEKYLAGEKPVVMVVPDLQPVLGDGWALIGSDSLGEFMTHLLLSYGADYLAEILDATAITASAGWGGDHYVVYASTSGDQMVLAAEWNWDTNNDQTEFLAAMRDYLNARFRGEKPNPPTADCWAMNSQTTCLFHTNRNTLWVLGPDMDTIKNVLSSYPAYG
jgi:hypothetical protein